MAVFFFACRLTFYAAVCSVSFFFFALGLACFGGGLDNFPLCLARGLRSFSGGVVLTRRFVMLGCSEEEEEEDVYSECWVIAMGVSGSLHAADVAGAGWRDPRSICFL